MLLLLLIGGDLNVLNPKGREVYWYMSNGFVSAP